MSYTNVKTQSVWHVLPLLTIQVKLLAYKSDRPVTCNVTSNLMYTSDFTINFTCTGGGKAGFYTVP